MIRDIRYNEIKARKVLIEIFGGSIFDYAIENITEITRLNIKTDEIETVHLYRYYKNGKKSEIELQVIEGVEL